jgi:hypothetical protein
MSDGLIHYCGYSSQPDIRICCDNSWTTPAWAKEGNPEPPEKDVHLADDMRFYTFDENRVTCKTCKRMRREMCPACGLATMDHPVENRDLMWGEGDVMCKCCGTKVRDWDSG